MKQLKPVYSKHVEDLIVQIEDILESRKEEIFPDFEFSCFKNWEEYWQRDRLIKSCREEILRIKATQLPMFYELV